MSKFCVDGSITNPKCYTTESFQFDSEEQIFDILLDVFKSELPALMYELKDCNGDPMVIEESSIDLLPPIQACRFRLVLNPLGDIPSYSENKMFRTVEYNFEFILTVGNEVAGCVTWELIRFKNAVEGLLIGAELAIDGYDSVDVQPKGFNYFVPTIEEGTYYREGSYKFSVSVGQYKIN